MLHQWLLGKRRVNRLIKSVQRGTITIGAGTSTQSGTLNPRVDENNCILHCLGFKSSDASGAGPDTYQPNLTWTDTTGTSLTASTYSNTGNAIALEYEVIEFWPGVIKSAQFGVITFVGDSAGHTSTINAVDLATASVFLCGMRSNKTGNYEPKWENHTVTLSDNVTVSAATNSDPVGSGLTWYIAWCVVDWV
jgi:hypothetical protein